VSGNSQSARHRRRWSVRRSRAQPPPYSRNTERMRRSATTNRRRRRDAGAGGDNAQETDGRARKRSNLSVWTMSKYPDAVANGSGPPGIGDRPHSQPPRAAAFSPLQL